MSFWELANNNLNKKDCKYTSGFSLFKKLYDFYAFFTFSEVKTYDTAFDSTLPSASKKRKFEENGDLEDVKPKVAKVEEGGDAPSSEKKKKKKKEKRKSEEPLEEGQNSIIYQVFKYSNNN